MSGDTSSGEGIFHRLMRFGWQKQSTLHQGPLAFRSREKAARETQVTKKSHAENLLVVLAQTDALPELLQDLLPVDWRSRTFNAAELRMLVKTIEGATIYDAALMGANVDEIDTDELKIFVKNLKVQWQLEHSAQPKAVRASGSQGHSASPSNSGVGLRGSATQDEVNLADAQVNQEPRPLPRYLHPAVRASAPQGKSNRNEAQPSQERRPPPSYLHPAVRVSTAKAASAEPAAADRPGDEGDRSANNHETSPFFVPRKWRSKL